MFHNGDVLSSGRNECTGLFVVCSGQLRAFILSENGKELTLYRLLPRDICLMSASCMLHSLQFDIQIEALEETVVYQIPTEAYKSIMEQSAAVANYTNELMASRFSEVVWLMDQVLNHRLGRKRPRRKRYAGLHPRTARQSFGQCARSRNAYASLFSRGKSCALNARQN